MLYTFFLLIAVFYNIRKFSKQKTNFLNSLSTANSVRYRDMILSHHFHIFIFEAFISFIVSHLISRESTEINLIGFGSVYVALFFLGLFLYQYFLKFIEKETGLEIRKSFNHHVIREFRVSFALVMLPILLYSLLNWTFQNDPKDGSTNFSIMEFFINIIFVSVLTIICTVIVMLKLLPNCEVSEPEYLDIIRKRLEQIHISKLRINWIETDIKNAFVVGLKLLRFSNQTMFIGKSLRELLTYEEFDAVIAHELAHIANRHIQKRIIEVIKNFISALLGSGLLVLLTFLVTFLYFGDDFSLYQKQIVFACTSLCVLWMFFNYSLFFDSIRSQEFEADAYAVMEMGASFEALKSALEKLSKKEELPEFLKDRVGKVKSNNWFLKLFSTHPDLQERISSLENKIKHQLPFNSYVSTPQKIRKSLSFILEWRVSIPLTAMVVFTGVWIGFSIQEGKQLVKIIKQQNHNQIISNQTIAAKINAKPFITGKSLMYFIVQKGDPKLIDHYLNQGADTGRTMIYLVDTKNFKLFKSYYDRLGSQLSENEYFLVLLRSAQVDFNEGYRLLVNSPQFDQMNTTYKAKIVRQMGTTSKREPASKQSKN